MAYRSKKSGLHERIFRSKLMDSIIAPVCTYSNDVMLEASMGRFIYRRSSSVEEAAKRIGITKMIGYVWQRRWNNEGYKGLIPRYAGKGPSKMSEEQRSLLKDRLKDGQYTTAHVRDIIRNEFGIEYTMKQAWIILKKMGMRHAKPYHHDKRRPKDAEDALKKT